MTGKIIFLSGYSSVGKSSIAKVIQHLSSEPWLTMGIDTFIDAMPSTYVDFGEKTEEELRFIHQGKKANQLLQSEVVSYLGKLTNLFPKSLNY